MRQRRLAVDSGAADSERFIEGNVVVSFVVEMVDAFERSWAGGSVASCGLEGVVGVTRDGREQHHRNIIKTARIK